MADLAPSTPYCVHSSLINPSGSLVVTWVISGMCIACGCDLKKSAVPKGSGAHYIIDLTLACFRSKRTQRQLLYFVLHNQYSVHGMRSISTTTSRMASFPRPRLKTAGFGGVFSIRSQGFPSTVCTVLQSWESAGGSWSLVVVSYV